MAFRRAPNYNYTTNQGPGAVMNDDQMPSPTMRKRPRPLDMHAADPPQQPSSQPVADESFITDHDAADSGADDDDDDAVGGKPASDKKAGRRKIKIEFIQDKSRRHITFSKRKAGIMKKAYELSTLTGTQVLLLVVSETGLVYTFTTAKLQPLVTQPEGKNLIQACLNAPHGTHPSAMPVGQPIGRSTVPPSHIPPPPNMGQPGTRSNVAGGIAIGGGGKDEDDTPDDGHDDQGAHEPTDKRPRRRAGSASGKAAAAGGGRSPTSPHQSNMAIPQQSQTSQQQIALGGPAGGAGGQPTSPSYPAGAGGAGGAASYGAPGGAQGGAQGQGPPGTQEQGGAPMYGGHPGMMPSYGYHPPQGGMPPPGGPQQGGPHAHWGPPQPGVQQQPYHRTR